MTTLEYDKLAKSLLLNDNNGIENFIGKYIEKNMGKITDYDFENNYDFTMRITDLLLDLAKLIPNISGSFDCRHNEDGYILILWDLIENNDGELKALYKVNFKLQE